LRAKAGHTWKKVEAEEIETFRPSRDLGPLNGTSGQDAQHMPVTRPNVPVTLIGIPWLIPCTTWMEGTNPKVSFPVPTTCTAWVPLLPSRISTSRPCSSKNPFSRAT